MNELARAARDLLAQRCTSERVRAHAPFDEALWTAMTEQGWLGLLVPESAGGLGLSAAEFAALCHELGRALAPVPFVGSVLASAATTDPDIQRFIVEGRPACVAFDDEQVVVDARPGALVIALGADVARSASGGITPQQGLDITRSFGTIDDRSGASLGAGDAGRIAHLGRLALAAESVGAAERALELAVAYAKDRVQFGKPIGSFQAVQHLLADALRHIELSRAATERAAEALTDGDVRAYEWCLIAKAKTGEACTTAVEIAIQVHGGIGYTWEHDIHLYYRRVRSNAALLGDTGWCNERLAEVILDGRPA